MTRENQHNTKNKMRQRMKKLMFDTSDINFKDIEASDLNTKAKAITLEEIVNAMFNRKIFMYKVNDSKMFMLMDDRIKDVIKEFAEHDYRRTEGRFLVRVGGIRYEKCINFKILPEYNIAMKVLDANEKEKSDYKTIKKSSEHSEARLSGSAKSTILPTQDKVERDF